MTRARFRLLMLAAAAGFVAVALLIRVTTGGQLTGVGRLEQYSGTALYASMVHAGTLAVWPRLTPWAAGGVALAWCWGVEILQLTGVPADLSARSLVARLVLGASFDAVDMLWYPVGVVPLVLLHVLLRRRSPR